MHTDILMTDPDTPLRVVGRLMAERRVHVVAIAEDGHMRRPLKMVSTLDVAAAVAAGEELDGRPGRADELRAIRRGEPIEAAARLMATHGVEHLIVIARQRIMPRASSRLDVAGALGR